MVALSQSHPMIITHLYRWSNWAAEGLSITQQKDIGSTGKDDMSCFGGKQTGPLLFHTLYFQVPLSLPTLRPSHRLFTLPSSLAEILSILQDPFQIPSLPQSYFWRPQSRPLLPTVLSLDLSFLDSTCVQVLWRLTLPTFLDHKPFGKEPLLLYSPSAQVI